jgi:hypothetical protein
MDIFIPQPFPAWMLVGAILIAGAASATPT